MRLLLDTHALLWWLAGDRQLSRRAKLAIANENSEIFVSAASACEVATKHRLGKLPRVGPLAVDFGLVPCPVTFIDAPSWRPCDR